MSSFVRFSGLVLIQEHIFAQNRHQISPTPATWPKEVFAIESPRYDKRTEKRKQKGLNMYHVFITVTCIYIQCNGTIVLA